MTHCAKCGAELIGSRKFCAACGAPAGDPRSPAASTGLAPVASGRTPPAPPSTRGSNPGSAPGSNPGSAPGSAPGGLGNQSSSPSIQYAPAPASLVNPFAQTAGPARSVRASDYGPPPASVPPELGTTTRGVGDPSSAPQVSPLAVSNVSSSRGAFENAITSGPASAAAAAAGLFPSVVQHSLAATAPDPAPSGGARGPVAGTQMMPSIANPAALPSTSPAGGTPASGAPSVPRPDRTQLLGAIPAGAFARPPSAPEHAQQPQPPAPVQPAQPPPPQPPPPQPPPPQQPQAPAWSPNPAPAQFIPTPQQPQMPYGAGGYPPQPQMPMAPPQQPPSAGYGFGYPPGSRVTVTWSNGQRYPGTVQQVSGSQCLVVFPDGQQHWVEMQYVAPA